MEIVQTARLDSDERKALGKAFGVIDKLSDTTHRTMEDVFCYLLEHSDIGGTYEYIVDENLDLEEI